MTTERVSKIRQATDTFATRYPLASLIKLTSVYDYVHWKSNLTTILSQDNRDIYDYFVSGILHYNKKASHEEKKSFKIALDNAIMAILRISVMESILAKYHAIPEFYGRKLLLQIDADYGTISGHQAFETVKQLMALIRSSSKNYEKIYQATKNVSLLFDSTDELFGSFILDMLPRDCHSEVLNAPTPDFHLDAVKDVMLKRIYEDGKTFSPEFDIDQVSSKWVKKQPVCRRCKNKGHNYLACTTLTPVSKSCSASSSLFTEDCELTSELPSDYVCLSSAKGKYTSKKFTISSNACSHICSDKFLFQTLMPSHGTVFDIALTPLTIEGIGTILFDAENGETITLTNVAYIPQATQNLVSVTQASLASGSSFTFTKDAVYCGNLMVGVRNTSQVYEFIFTPRIPFTHVVEG